MNTNSNENRIGDGIEGVLTFLSTLIVAATPVCALWVLNASPVITLVG